MKIKPELDIKLFTEEFSEYGQSLGLDITFNPYTYELIYIYGLSPAKKELLVETLDLIMEELLATFEEVDDEEVDRVLSMINDYINTISNINLLDKQLLH